jgi:peptidoglycan/LPS O-acetylase OafA/YrhL
MKYIRGFDSLRAISIILVLSAHLGLTISGGAGVMVLFTLSGFLITTILLREKEQKGTINFKNFYVRRFLRLLPPLIVFYIIISSLMTFNQIESTTVGFLFSFFYLYNFVPTQFYTNELGHTWSLALEEQFYLTWPFIINYITRKFSIILIIISIISLCVTCYYLIPELASSRNSRWFIPAVAPIMVGCLVAILNYSNVRWKKLLSKNTILIFIAIICFAFPIYSPDLGLSFSIIIQPLGVALFLLWILYNQETRITKILDNRVLSYIGKISYGLYVYQGIFLGTGPGGRLLIQQFPYNIILVVLVASISYEFIEKPVLSFKSKFR